MKGGKRAASLCFLMACAFVATVGPVSSSIIRVKCNSTYNGPGNDWDHGYHTVAAGLNAAKAGDQVWVARCTYTERITMKSGVELYGGFAGTETILGQRPPFPRPTPDIYETVLDGTVPYGQPCSSVVKIANMTGVVVDGFTVKNGCGFKKSNEAGVESRYGGGFYCAESSSILITHCIIANNGAQCGYLDCSGDGGGIYISDCPSVSLTENSFVANAADSYGGGICCLSSTVDASGNTVSGNNAEAEGGGGYFKNSTVHMSSSVIRDNGVSFWGSGGGLRFDACEGIIAGNTINANQYNGISCSRVGSSLQIAKNVITTNYQSGIGCNDNASPLVEGNSIIGNDGTGGSGGGVGCYGNSSPVIRGNWIVGNRARFGGGVFCRESCSPLVINNTIAGNYAEDDGGGIYCYVRTWPWVYSNVIVGNRTQSNYTGAFECSGDCPVFKNNCFFDNGANPYGGPSPIGSNGNFLGDPLFAEYGHWNDNGTPANPDDDSWVNGDCHLTGISPCIDVGLNEYALLPVFDIDDEPRIQNGTVDIGADEYWPPDPPDVRTIVASKAAADGTFANLLSATVSGGFRDFFYVEKSDRSCGIRVEMPGLLLSAGKTVHIHGVLTTNADRERCIAARVVAVAGDGSVDPLGLPNCRLGGVAFEYDPGPPVTGQCGVEGGLGLNNIGLLVRVWGRVTCSGRDWFYVDDGSCVSDGSGILGLYVEADTMQPPAPGSYVCVTGLSSCDLYLGNVVSRILPRTQNDIVIVLPAGPGTLSVSTNQDRPNPRRTSG